MNNTKLHASPVKGGVEAEDPVFRPYFFSAGAVSAAVLVMALGS